MALQINHKIACITLAILILEVMINLKQFYYVKKLKYEGLITYVYSTDTTFKTMKEYQMLKLLSKQIQLINNMLICILVFKSRIIKSCYNSINRNIGLINQNKKQAMFGCLFMIFTFIINLPYEILKHYYIERKYGISRNSKNEYIINLITNFIIELISSFCLSLSLIKIIQKYKRRFWITLTIISITCIAIAHILLLLKTLDNSNKKLNFNLLMQIKSLANDVGYDHKKILVENVSGYTSIANAYFAGFFKYSIIVIYDTLLEIMSNEEICAIICHELGHFYFNHTFKLLILSIFITLIYFYYMEYYLKSQYSEDNGDLIIEIIKFGIISATAIPLVEFFIKFLTRYFEFQADGFAMSKGYGKYLTSALLKLTERNMECVDADKFYFLLHHTHPTTQMRVNKIIK